MSIEKFAIWARKELISRVSQRAYQYGITDSSTVGDSNALSFEGRVFTELERKQRKELINEIQVKGYNQVMEEVAYTWFNRFIALRFMEINNYLPSHIRVFTDINGKFKPEIIDEALNLDFTELDKQRVAKLINDSNQDELYRYLLLIQCNELNKCLPMMFERMGSYTELLLPNNILSQDGIIGRMLTEIDESEWNKQVEIIGWLYQYYIKEKHEEVVDPLRGKTIKKEDIPAATQLFTTDWVVRYMVDNSLGRYWLERHPESQLSDKLEFLLTPKSGLIEHINESIKPQEMTFFDPCVGSGHILVYAFDVLMEIYKECGYDERDAAREIVENNLFGLDIDDRAGQLAYFAVMMKARSYDRRFLDRNIEPNIMAIQESNVIKNLDSSFIKENRYKQIYDYLKNSFFNAKEIGSLLSIKCDDYKDFCEYLNNISVDKQTLSFATIKDYLIALSKQANILSNKYTVVCTNPPYMNKMEGNLKSFLIKEFKDYSSDLFSAFIYHNFSFCKNSGYSAFMTPFVWMFIKTYEKLRNYIIENKSINSIIQMEYSAFEQATVPICTFVLHNNNINKKCLGIKLSAFKGGMDVQKQKVLDAINNKNCGYFYESNVDNFKKIPGSPFAYWVGKNTFDNFSNKSIATYYIVRNGISTGDNNKYLRLWFELNDQDTDWKPCNKGGAFRKWYGNNEYYVYWANDGHLIKTSLDDKGRVKSRLGGVEFSFLEGVEMSRITSGTLGFRFSFPGFIYESSTNDIYQNSKEYDLKYVLGLCNSKVTSHFLCLMNPTINIMPEDIRKLPYRFSSSIHSKIVDYVNQNINNSKTDWDSFETSWDFEKHPLVRLKSRNLKNAFSLWMAECDNRFNQLKANEEELNRIFIDIYELNDELTPEVEEKDVTVRKADLQREVKSLISYAVGCMFGRYSLDVDGLAFAGGEWDSSKYKTFIPDDDNIIPICDNEYFSDDIVARFVEWVETVYGSEDLEGNLAFIAGALGGQGASRDVIRKYFLNDFFADHCKIYQKRPIYWLFDSGKKNGFKALIYMHRYSRDLLACLRTDYVHEQQERYETKLHLIEEALSNADTKESVKLKREQTKISDQAMELHNFERKIHDLADKNIEIDLDDGVKYNYALFADVLAKLK